jgi:colanic acid/amylovoran biosynthesis glycosyltransferase
MLLNPALRTLTSPETNSTEAVALTANRPNQNAAASTRLGYLVSEYPGVSHTFILREVLGLRRLGFQVEVASINRPYHALQRMTLEERAETAATHYVKADGWRGALVAHLQGLRRPHTWLRGLGQAIRLGGWDLRRQLYSFFYFTEALMLARWLRTHQIDHLHVHFATAAANVGLILKQVSPMTLSMTVHGPDEFYDAKGEWLDEKIAATDFIVCISQFARSQLMKLAPAQHWHKLAVCPLGVDTEHFRPLAKQASTETFRLLCVGRLAPAKGQRILIEACRLLRERGRAFQLELVGDGPDRPELEAAMQTYGLQGQVRFRGALNHDEVHGCYRAADAFVLPSFAEGVPVVLMEAMASGVPCVTTRITGIPELIRHDCDGLLVTPSDVEALAEAIERLIDDPDLRQRLAASGRDRVQKNYQLDRNIERLADLFYQRLEKLPC